MCKRYIAPYPLCYTMTWLWYCKRSIATYTLYCMYVTVLYLQNVYSHQSLILYHVEPCSIVFLQKVYSSYPLYHIPCVMVHLLQKVYCHQSLTLSHVEPYFATWFSYTLCRKCRKCPSNKEGGGGTPDSSNPTFSTSLIICLIVLHLKKAYCLVY